MLENATLEKKLDVLARFLDRVKLEAEKGRDMIWIDKKLLEWLDKQVEMGKYRSCSHAVEKIIQSKMREETTRAYEI